MQDRIDALRATIARKEATIVDLEARVLDIERELGNFAARFDRTIQPLQDRLDLLNDLIADLEHEHFIETYAPSAPQMQSEWTPPPGYVSVEEQFRRAWQQTPNPPELEAVPQATQPEVDQPLKTLYRKLVRRYHPDLTTDAVERERRTALMQEINDAYARRDHAALQTLIAQPEDAPAIQPLASIQLRQLEQINEQLTRRIGHLRTELHELENGELMSLKIKASLATSQGRDLLAEMAADMEHQLATAQRRLDRLRGR